MSAHLIDTNVMLAASAIHDAASNLAEHASPRERALRELVYRELVRFQESDDRLVLDDENLIRDEYERNMPFNTRMGAQEYGLFVLQDKLDRDQVNWVFFDFIEGNGERIAVLSDELCVIVTDREDRKWIAAAMAHAGLYESVSPITYGAESDWYVIEDALAPYGIQFRRLLPREWYES